jgi:hypothetical protein
MITKNIDARALAHRRWKLHEGTSRKFYRDKTIEEYVGIKGEIQFASEFGLEVDTVDRLEGDGGIDFVLPIGNINVKTYRKPYNLLVKTTERLSRADIYVLVGYSEVTDNATLLGWEWKTEMLRCPTKNFGFGFVNYYKPAHRLRSIVELKSNVGVELGDTVCR